MGDMDMMMMDAWMAWMMEYGYMDGMDADDIGDMDADDIRMMAMDYLYGCDAWDAPYDDTISADMIAWARR